MLGWIAQGLGVLLLVVVVLVAGIFTYLRTDAGLAHLARLIEGLASSEEHINHRKSRGAFPEHLRLENISLTDDQGTLIAIDFVELRWRPWKLLSRHLNVTAFEVGTVDVNRLPAAKPAWEQEAGPMGLPSLPVDVALDAFRRAAAEAKQSRVNRRA